MKTRFKSSHRNIDRKKIQEITSISEKILKSAFTQSAENRRKSVTDLVTLTSRSDSDFESSNVSLKENKPDGVNPNSNDIDY